MNPSFTRKALSFTSPAAAATSHHQHQLPSSTMAVPVQYLGSSDITGLQTPAHFYRIILPPLSSSISGHQQDLLSKRQEEFDQQKKASNSTANVGEKESSVDAAASAASSPPASTSKKTNMMGSNNNTTDNQQLFDDEASPIIYVLSTAGTNAIAKNHHHNAHHLSSNFINTNNQQQQQSSLALRDQTQTNSNDEAFPTMKDVLVETIEFAHIQCLLMPKSDAQKLIDEAGCVPSRIWKTVPLVALCASSDFPIASATAISGVGKVVVGGDSSNGNKNFRSSGLVDDDEGEDDDDDDENDNNNSHIDDENNNTSTTVIGVRITLTRARRVIHIMNDNVVSSESSSASKTLRGLCAALWCTLVLHATEEALEYVKPILTVLGGGAGNHHQGAATSTAAMVGAAHSARLRHIRRIKKRRESLFTVDATAGAALQSELRESKTLTQATTAIRQQLYRSLGRVTDLVGSAMRYEVDWSSVERPSFGRKLRRTHFRPLIQQQQQQQTSMPAPGSSSQTALPMSSKLLSASAAASSFHHHHNNTNSTNSDENNNNNNDTSSADEPVFLWSRALPPIPVVLARQGWERCVQMDPVMWRFKSLPVRLKETTTKLSRFLSCSTSDMMITESTQIARSTVLRSLPWTPGDCLLLVDGLPTNPNGNYNAISSFLKEQHGVVVHTLGMSHPISSNSELIVNAFARAIDLVKPLVCIIPHITRTGHVLPIETLIPLCRERNVVVIVDGTDVLNNVATQVGSFGADFYIAPLDGHLFCPSGMTALIVSSTRKKAIDTLTVSYFFGQGFQEEWTYTGLTDQSRMISVMQALQFTKAVCPHQQQYTKQLAAQAHEFLTKFWDVPPLYEKNEPESAVMAVLLPLSGQRHDADAKFLQALLIKKQIFVEILAIRFARSNDHKLVVRLVFYPYNDMLEVKKLAIAMQQCVQKIS